MNILIYRYGSICEPDIIMAFKNAGINIITEDTEITNKTISSKERIMLVEKHIKESNPLFIFSINFFPCIADLCHIYRTPYLFWTVDSPVPELFSASIRHDTNRGFLFDYAQYQSIVNLNPDNIFHLPLAGATDRFDNVISSITAEDLKSYSKDITFVGSLYTEKDELAAFPISNYLKGYIDGISEAAMRIYGTYIIPDIISDKDINDILKYSNIKISNTLLPIDQYIVSHSLISYHIAAIERTYTLNQLAKHFNVDLYTRSNTDKLQNVNIHNGVNTLSEMPKVINLSKINLNMTLRSIETGLPLRCFDIMGCGGFLITNYQDEISDMFEIGNDLETYSSIEELIDKCRFYLENDDLRQKIAINGYNKVKNNHTYYHRIKSMLETII